LLDHGSLFAVLSGAGLGRSGCGIGLAWLPTGLGCGHGGLDLWVCGWWRRRCAAGCANRRQHLLRQGLALEIANVAPEDELGVVTEVVVDVALQRSSCLRMVAMRFR